MPASSSQRTIIGLLLGQATLTVAGGALGWMLGDAASGLSALAGGSLALGANLIVLPRMFGRYDARHPEHLLGRFYGAAMMRLLFAGIVLAALIVGFESLKLAPLIGAYLAVQVLTPLMVDRVAR